MKFHAVAGTAGLVCATVLAGPEELQSPALAVDAWAAPYCGVATVRIEQVGMFLPADEAESPFRIRKKATLTFRWPDAMLEIRSQQWVMPGGEAIPLGDSRMPPSAAMRLERAFVQVIAPTGASIARFDDDSVDKQSGPVSFAEISRAYFGVTPWVAAHYICDMKARNLRVERVDERVFVHLDAENATLEFGKKNGAFQLEVIERRRGDTAEIRERVEFRQYQQIAGVPFAVPMEMTVRTPLVIYNEKARTTSDGPLREEGTVNVLKFEIPGGIEDSFFVLPARRGEKRSTPETAGGQLATPGSASLASAVPPREKAIQAPRAGAENVGGASWWWVGAAGAGFVVVGVILSVRKR